MCCNNSNRSSCGCDRGMSGCGCARTMPRCHCGCHCCCGCGGGATTLPAFPDFPAWSRQEMEFPVYVSMPATMARGTANFSASVERMEEPCGCSRG